MANTLKQLAQQTGAAAAASMYSPGSGEVAIITTMVVANTGSSDRTFSIYIDDNGTTYTAATALYKDVPIPANTTYELSVKWFMNNSSGNLAVDQDAGTDVNFTLFGVVQT